MATLELPLLLLPASYGRVSATEPQTLAPHNRLESPVMRGPRLQGMESAYLVVAAARAMTPGSMSSSRRHGDRFRPRPEEQEVA
jgi:hypothetical protein